MNDGNLVFDQIPDHRYELNVCGYGLRDYLLLDLQRDVVIVFGFGVFCYLDLEFENLTYVMKTREK